MGWSLEERLTLTLRPAWTIKQVSELPGLLHRETHLKQTKELERVGPGQQLNGTGLAWHTPGCEGCSQHGDKKKNDSKANCGETHPSGIPVFKKQWKLEVQDLHPELDCKFKASSGDKRPRLESLKKKKMGLRGRNFSKSRWQLFPESGWFLRRVEGCIRIDPAGNPGSESCWVA